jgi:hypothetical protein
LAAVHSDDCRLGGFALSARLTPSRTSSAFEAVEKPLKPAARSSNSPGQKPSAEHPDLKLHHDATDETVAAVSASCQAQNSSCQLRRRRGQDEAEWRKIFEFAKKLDLYAITTEDVRNLDAIEKLVKEFDIRVAYHEHAKRPNDPSYKLWIRTTSFRLSKAAIRASCLRGHGPLGHVRSQAARLREDSAGSHHQRAPERPPDHR